jgi:hypothetical protein
MGEDIAKCKDNDKRLFTYCISPAHFFRHYSFQQHTQLSTINTIISSTYHRNAETTFLQSFIPQSESIMVPVKELDHIPAAVAEDEQRARQGIGTEFRAN